MPFLNLHQSRKLALSIWLMVNIIYIISLWHIARADQFHKSQTWALIKSGKSFVLVEVPAPQPSPVSSESEEQMASLEPEVNRASPNHSLRSVSQRESHLSAVFNKFHITSFCASDGRKTNQPHVHGSGNKY